jgi:hypothetical protein
MKRNNWINYGTLSGFIVLALVIVWLAPAEQTLGNFVKLIYLHAALVFVSLVMYSGVGLLGLFYLVTSRDMFLKWALPAKQVALIFWFIYIVSSMVTMKLIWGAVVWAEPRFVLAVSAFVVLLGIYLLSIAFETPRLVSLFNVAMAASIWILISRVPRILHPGSAIRSSPSLAIKVSALAVSLLLLAAAVQAARILYRVRHQNL